VDQGKESTSIKPNDQIMAAARKHERVEKRGPIKGLIRSLKKGKAGKNKRGIRGGQKFSSFRVPSRAVGKRRGGGKKRDNPITIARSQLEGGERKRTE